MVSCTWLEALSKAAPRTPSMPLTPLARPGRSWAPCHPPAPAPRALRWTASCSWRAAAPTQVRAPRAAAERCVLVERCPVAPARAICIVANNVLVVSCVLSPLPNAHAPDKGLRATFPSRAGLLNELVSLDPPTASVRTLAPLPYGAGNVALLTLPNGRLLAIGGTVDASAGVQVRFVL